MKTPRVLFQYDLAKDAENIQIGLGLIRNGREPETLLASLIKEYGENPTPADINKYLTNYWRGKEGTRDDFINQLQVRWDALEKHYFSTVAEKMQLESFFELELIPAYLSARRGCGYNYGPSPWFAVSIQSDIPSNILTTMHEVMHIFFHRQWWDFCEERGVHSKNVWDIKEAVTVLLNLWFEDQLSQTDRGKNEHANLREEIKRWSAQGQDFRSILENACQYMKGHPQESPTWIK